MVQKIVYALLIISFLQCKSQNLKDINHVVHMGQSLGAGEQSLPLVTTEDTGYGNLKFKIGTHTWSNTKYAVNPETRNDSLFVFVPLTAQQRGAEGETIANGLCDHFTETSKEKGKLLFSYSGQGGRYLRELDKRHDDAKDPRAKGRRSKGGYYKTSVNDIKKAKKIAETQGKTYNVLATTWMQGESNNSLIINRWSPALERKDFLKTYKDDLINIKKDFDEDVSKILNKKVNIPFFTYQTIGATSGKAQLMACNETANMYMVSPVYMLPNAENTYYKYQKKNYHGAGIHLTADAERWLGEQFGKVIKRVVIDKEDWKPLQPQKVYLGKNKSEIFIEYHVPRPPLVLDTLFLPKQGNNYGFKLVDNGERVRIKNVRVFKKNTIKIIASKPLTQYVKVSYALSSFVKNISKPIVNIIELTKNKHEHKEIAIEFKGDITNEFRQVLKEGVFYLANNLDYDKGYTNIIARKVIVTKNGNTQIIGELDDLRKGINFKTGQQCAILREYPYGNLRDSDNEKSTFKFSNNSYGTRAGSYYPLFNWSVAFRDLKVE